MSQIEPCPEIDALIARVHRTARRLKLAPASLAATVLGSGRELERLAAGGDIGTRKRKRALAFLATLEHENRNTPGRTAPGDPPNARRRNTNARAK